MNSARTLGRIEDAWLCFECPSSASRKLEKDDDRRQDGLFIVLDRSHSRCVRIRNDLLPRRHGHCLEQHGPAYPGTAAAEEGEL